MKSRILLIGSLCLFPGFLKAQTTFQKDGGGFFAQPAVGGGYFSTERTYRDGNSYDIYVVKNRNDGSLKWVKTFNAGGAYEEPYSLVATADSGCTIVGSSYNGISFYSYILKLDSLGNIKNSKSYGAGFYYDVQNTSDKGTITGGTVNGLSTLTKWKLDGTLDWSFSYDTGTIYSVTRSIDKGYVATGTRTIAGVMNAIYFKVDSAGSVKWSKALSCQYGAYGQSLTPAIGGGYIFTGGANFKQLVHGSQAYICKIDENGNVLWIKYLENAAKIAVTDNDWGNFIRQTPDNNYIMCIMGQLNFQLTNNILKIDPAGNCIWSRVYGGLTLSGNVNFSATVYPTSDNGYIVSEGNLYKTDQNGNAGCPQQSSVYNTLTGSLTLNDISINRTVQNSESTITFIPTAESGTAHNIMVPLPKMTITPDGPTTFCAGNTVDLTASGNGFGPYLWNTGSNWQTIPVSTSGNYVVMGISASGCTSLSDTLKVVVNPLPASAKITALGDTIFCQGDSVHLIAPAGTGYQYMWYLSGFPTTQSVYAKFGSVIQVQITNQYACSKTSSGSEIVTLISNNPVIPQLTINGNTSICKGDSVRISSSKASSYLWPHGETTQSVFAKTNGSYNVTTIDSNGCKATSSSQYININSPSVNMFTNKLSACEGDSIYAYGIGANTYNWSNGQNGNYVFIKTSGTYSVIGQDLYGCIDTSDQVILNFNPLPLPVIRLDAGNIICQGSDVILSTTTPFVTYTWPGAITTPTYTVSLPGSYSVSVTDLNGCRGFSSPFTVSTSGNTPPAPIIIRTDTLCTGNTASLSADKNYNSYLWSNGDTSSITTITFGGLYRLTVSDTNGCSGSSEYILVTSHPKPFCNILSAGGFGFCEGYSDTLRTNTVFSSYLWSTGATTQKIGVNNPGSYSITVTDANSCQNTPNAVIETSHSNPVVSISAGGPTTFCNGKNVNLSASGVFNSYSWSNGSISPNLVATQTGSYYLIASNQYHCSGTSNSIAVTVTPGPSVSISALDTTNFCEGNSVTLNSTGSFPIYNWSSGQTSPNVTVSESANYSLQVTDSNGCKGQSNSIVVNVYTNPYPSVLASKGLALCGVDSTTMSTTVPYESYNWSTGQSSSEITATQPGKYAVWVSDSHGCLGKSDSVTLTVSPQPISDFSYQLNDQQVSFTNNSQDAIQYIWDFGDNSSLDFNTNPSHNYAPGTNNLVSLIATYNNCSDTSWQTINIFPITDVSMNKTGHFSVYPNPNNGIFNLEFPASEEIPNYIEIYNINGEIVYSLTTKNRSTHIQLPENLKGVFFLKAENIDWYFQIIIE